MVVHNCGFSGRMLHAELIMLSVALINEDNTNRRQVHSMKKDCRDSIVRVLIKFTD
jgi:hypothetical protein